MDERRRQALGESEEQLSQELQSITAALTQTNAETARLEDEYEYYEESDTSSEAGNPDGVSE